MITRVDSGDSEWSERSHRSEEALARRAARSTSDHAEKFGQH